MQGSSVFPHHTTTITSPEGIRKRHEKESLELPPSLASVSLPRPSIRHRRLAASLREVHGRRLPPPPAPSPSPAVVASSTPPPSSLANSAPHEKMARSAFAAARLAAYVVSKNPAAISVSRRSFSAAAAKVEEKAASVSRNKKTKPVEGLVDSPTTSWVPDPVTGYYYPGNLVVEVDPAEMRQRLLSKTITPALRH